MFPSIQIQQVMNSFATNEGILCKMKECGCKLVVSPLNWQTNERLSWSQFRKCFGTKYIQFAKFSCNGWLKKAVASSSSFQLPERVFSTTHWVNMEHSKTSDLTADNDVARNEKG